MVDRTEKLSSLSVPDQNDLVRLMLQYIDHDIVMKHIQDDKKLGIHETDRELFYTWHDNYIAGMETCV